MNERKILPILFFTIFVDFIGFGILIPVIPQLLVNPESSSYLLHGPTSIKQGYVLLGFLIGVFPLGLFLSSPILGQLSDKYGRKRLLAFALAGMTLAHGIFGVGILLKSIYVLFFARILAGLSGGYFAVTQASIADITKPNDRAKNFGLIGAAFGLGFILGPFIGGKLSDPTIVSWFNATTPFFFASLLGFLNVISLLLFLPETHKTPNREISIRWSKSIYNIFAAVRMKKLRLLFLNSFIFHAGFAFYITFFNVYLLQKFSFTQGDIGNYFAYTGFWMAFTQLVIIRFLSGKVSETSILRVTLIGAGLGIGAMFFPSASWGIFFIAPMLAMCSALSFANLAGLVSRSASADIQGEVLGINSSVQGLGQAIPGFLSGFIAVAIAPEFPLVISAVLIIISGLLFNLLYKKYAILS